MIDLLLILLIIPLLGCLFVLSAKKNDINAFYVTVFTVVSSMAVVLRLLPKVIHTADNTVSSYTHQWLQQSNISLSFGADVFSLLLLLGVYIAILIGLVGLFPEQRKSKALLLSATYFLWCITGFLVARDLVSFYMFFAGMVIPVLILIGIYGNVRKISTLYVFFALFFIGALVLLTATLIIYRFNHGNVSLPEIALTTMPKQAALIVWIGVCIAFLSRIPIWPIHHWFYLISNGIKNPLIYIILNLLPLTGVYGFMRFWQLTVPQSAEMLLPIMTVFGVMTMLFTAFIGISHKDFLPKLFSYSAVYYLLFLLVIVLLDTKYAQNIAYSLFTFLIVNATLTVLELWSENACSENRCDYRGVLAYMPRLSKIFAFFVLVAVGLPISSMFWNNFVLISALFKENFMAGIGVMTAITLIGMGIIFELFIMRKLPKNNGKEISVADISDKQTAFFMIIVILLFLSFFDPLWFVF